MSRVLLDPSEVSAGPDTGRILVDPSEVSDTALGSQPPAAAPAIPAQPAAPAATGPAPKLQAYSPAQTLHAHRQAVAPPRLPGQEEESLLDPLITLLAPLRHIPVTGIAAQLRKALDTPEGQAAADTARGLATPENAAIMGGIGAAKILIPFVGTAVDVGAAGYFGKQMLEAGIAAEADMQAFQQNAIDARKSGDEAAAKRFDDKARYARAQKYIATSFAVTLLKAGVKKGGEAAVSRVGETPIISNAEVRRRVMRDQPQSGKTEPPIGFGPEREVAVPKPPAVEPEPEALGNLTGISESAPESRELYETTEVSAGPPEVEPETKPPAEAATPVEAAPLPETKPQRESTVKTFQEDFAALKQHPAIPDVVREPVIQPAAEFEQTIKNHGESLSDETLGDYIVKLRRAAELHAPDNPTIMEHIELAEEAHQSGDKGEALWEAERARGRGGLSTEYQDRLRTEGNAGAIEAQDEELANKAEAKRIQAEQESAREAEVQKRRAAIMAEAEKAKVPEEAPAEFPPATKEQRDAFALERQKTFGQEGKEQEIRAKELAEEPTTTRPLKSPREMTDDIAHDDMQHWADLVRNMRDAREAEANAGTMESNVYGKALEEEAVARSREVGRSLGVKEGSPLAEFKESPKALLIAIDKGKGKLYERIVEAFQEAAHELHGEEAEAFHARETAGETAPPVEEGDTSFDFGGEDLEFTAPELPVSESVLGQTAEEGMRRLVSGRKPEQIKEGKEFDTTRLVESPLFAGRGGEQRSFGEEKGHAPILDDAVRAISKAVDNVLEYVGIDAVPRLTKAGVQPEAVAHASARTAVPRMVDDMLAKVFPDAYKKPAVMEKTMRILVLDNILGGYRDLRANAMMALAAGDKKAAARLTKIADHVRTRHDLDAYAKEVKGADPETVAAIGRWKQVVNPVMDQLYNEMKGMDPNTPRDGRGRFYGARVNLIAKAHEAEWLKSTVRGQQETPSPPSPKTASYRNPNVRQDRFDRMAQFNAAEYSTDPVAILASSMFPRWTEVTKRRLYTSLVDKGVAFWEKPEKGDFRAAPVDVPETKDGVTRTVRKVLWIPPELTEEFRGVLGTDLPLKQNPVARFLTKIQLASLADATSHLKNIHSVIANAQGTKAMWRDVARKMPGISSIDSLVRIGQAMYEVSQDTPAIRTELAEMAKAGMTREHFPATGLQKITKIQDLIHNADTASRVVMNRFYDNLVQRGLAKDTADARRAFVQQVGEYNKRLMGPMMRAASQSGLSPFIVAGRNFNRFSKRLITGATGVEATSGKAALQMRAVNLMTLGTMMALPAMINKLTSDSITGRPGTPLGAIDLGQPEDKRGNHKILDIAQLYGLRRGMRATGIQAISEGLMKGDNIDDIVGRGIYDVVSTGTHPWLGPALGFGVSAMTGQRLDLRGGPMPIEAARMEDTGSQLAENVRVAFKNQNALLYSPLRGAFSDVEESPGKDFLKDFLKAPASAVGVSDRVSPAIQAAREASVRIQTTPGQKERAQLRRRISNAFDAGQDDEAEQMITDAVGKDMLSKADIKEIDEERDMSPIERAAWRLPLEQLVKVWARGTPAEKETIEGMMARKIKGSTAPPPIIERARDILAGVSP